MSSLQTEPGTQVSRARSAARSAPRASRPTTRNATLTIAGVMYILVTLFLAVGAINAQNNLLFWLFGFAIALLITSGILSGNAMMRLSVRASTITDARAGIPHPLRYRLDSHSRMFPLFGLVIREEETDLQTDSPAIVVHLSPGESAETSGWILAHKRGRYDLPAFRVESSFPFGIIRKWIRFEQPRTVTVLPHELHLQPSLFLSQPGARSEDHQSKPRRGSGSEFFGLRQYVAGDSRRKIAWKTSARRNGLVVIQHAQETEPRVMIWLRKPAAADHPVLVERTIALAASVSRAVMDSGCAVGFWAPWVSIRFNPGSGASQLHRIEYALANLDLSAADESDSAPQSVSGRVIQVVCTDASAPSSTGDTFAADHPDSWLFEGEQLPDALVLPESPGA